jgi:YD repeat-containing protein
MDAPIIAAQVEQAPARQTLRDARGTLIGTLEHQRLTGKIVARDARGRLVGTYDERSGGHSGTTRDARGRLVGKGNLLPALLVGAR